MRNGNAVQNEIAKGELYVALNQAADRVKDSVEYDYLDADERRWAVLCHAIEKSAEGRDGTSVTLWGVLKTLRTLGVKPQKES